MEVFTLCDCDITNSYTAHYEQKQIAVANRTVWTGPYCQERLSIGGLVHTEQFKAKNYLTFFVPHNDKCSIQQQNKIFTFSTPFFLVIVN